MCDGIFSKEPARRRGSCGRNGRRICAIPPLRLEYAGNAPRCCPVRGKALECRVERGNMMKRMIAVFGVIAVLQAPAVERRVMEGSSFSMAGCRVSQLGEEEVLPEAVSEVRGAIAGWVEKDFRRKSLTPLAGYGFDIGRAKEMIVIEWGRRLRIPGFVSLGKNFLFREAPDRNLTMEEIRFGDSIFREVCHLRSIVGKNGYLRGNLSGFCCDVPTCVVTLLDREKKTAVLYGGAVAKPGEKTLPERPWLDLGGVIFLSCKD